MYGIIKKKAEAGEAMNSIGIYARKYYFIKGVLIDYFGKRR